MVQEIHLNISLNIMMIMFKTMSLKVTDIKLLKIW